MSVIWQVADPESRGYSLLKANEELESCQEHVRPRILHRYKQVNLLYHIIFALCIFFVL